jgi:hypothetical protein
LRRTLEIHSAKVYTVTQSRDTRARFAGVESRTERVVVETDRYRVEGLMTLPREGHRSRVSDHVNRRDAEFFTLVDCDLVALDGSERAWKAPVVMLARRHIRLIVPASEGA